MGYQYSYNWVIKYREPPSRKQQKAAVAGQNPVVRPTAASNKKVPLGGLGAYGVWGCGA